MAHIVLIDDDPAVIPTQVRQTFTGPGNRVEIASTIATVSSRSGLIRRM
jgi:hypothetical protein